MPISCLRRRGFCGGEFDIFMEGFSLLDFVLGIQLFVNGEVFRGELLVVMFNVLAIVNMFREIYR